MKHTPGPWHDGRIPSRGRIYIVPSVSEGGVFEWTANARLIAAAPELLAALETARALLEHVPHIPDEAHWHQINAAIRKARGEEDATARNTQPD